MSEQVEIVRRGYEALTRSGEPRYENWHPDFVWDMSTFRGWPEDPEYVGTEGYERFMRDWLEPFEHWNLEPEEYVDAGERVAVIVHQRGRAKSSGATVEMRFGQVWTFRDGKVARSQLYADPNEALAAVGAAS